MKKAILTYLKNYCSKMVNSESSLTDILLLAGVIMGVSFAVIYALNPGILHQN